MFLPNENRFTSNQRHSAEGNDENCGGSDDESSTNLMTSNFRGGVYIALGSCFNDLIYSTECNYPVTTNQNVLLGARCLHVSPLYERSECNCFLHFRKPSPSPPAQPAPATISLGGAPSAATHEEVSREHLALT